MVIGISRALAGRRLHLLRHRQEKFAAAQGRFICLGRASFVECLIVINVWCVCVGEKYTSQHVDNLAKMVGKNLSRPWQLVVITDKSLGIIGTYGECVGGWVICNKSLTDAYPGWWSKILIHKFSEADENIYFDLDVIITGNIDCLADNCYSFLSMTKNWPESGHGGFQSSVMAWHLPNTIYEDFDPSKIGPPVSSGYAPYGEYDGKYHGDQEWLSANYGDKISEIPPGLIVSYKYHCKDGVPDGARIVCFHGQPDYWEVEHDWIKKALL